jgi:hypothetical protein
LQVTITANIERVAAEAIKKTLAENSKAEDKA